MTGHQRITSALKGEWPDKRPIMLHNFMMAAHEAGMNMKEYRSNPEKAAKAHIEAVEKYNLDGVLIDFDTATLAATVGVPVEDPATEPSRCSGKLLGSLKNVEELERVDISLDERIQIWLETSRLIKEYFGDEIFVRGNCDQSPFSLASMIRSSEAWLVDLLIDEESSFELLDFCTDITGQFIRKGKWLPGQNSEGHTGNQFLPMLTGPVVVGPPGNDHIHTEGGVVGESQEVGRSL